MCLTFEHERSIEEVNADHREEADDGEFIVAVRGVRPTSAETDVANGDDDQPEFGVVKNALLQASAAAGASSSFMWR